MGLGSEGIVRELALVSEVAAFGVEELAWKFACVRVCVRVCVCVCALCECVCVCVCVCVCE